MHPQKTGSDIHVWKHDDFRKKKNAGGEGAEMRPYHHKRTPSGFTSTLKADVKLKLAGSATRKKDR